MRFVPLFLAATLVASPLQAQSAASADDARAVLAAVLAHQVAIRGLESAAQACVTAALAPPPVAAGEEDPMMPDHAVRIYFQWHVPEAAATIRPPRPPQPDGQRRRNRERPPPVVLPAPVAADLAQQLDARRAEAARSQAAPAIDQVDAALLTPPMQLQGANNGCAPLHLRRDRLCLRHDLRQWQPLRPPAPRRPLDRDRGGGHLDQLRWAGGSAILWRKAASGSSR